MSIPSELMVLSKEYREEGFEDIAKGFEELAKRAASDLGSTYFEDVREFEKFFGKIPEKPILIDPKEWAVRVRLINEEWAELSAAYANGDLQGFADGVVDLVWVVLGTGVRAGLPFDALWAEVRRANMDKKGAGLDKTGKLMKPRGWKAPNIERILAEASR